jgi:Xaa-Pro aminopeptidase
MAVMYLEEALAHIRAGKASTRLLDGIRVDSYGSMVSFPVILSQNGETLHNHDHSKTLTVGRMMLTDAGAENNMCYCSDFTRSVSCLKITAK